MDDNCDVMEEDYEYTYDDEYEYQDADDEQQTDGDNASTYSVDDCVNTPGDYQISKYNSGTSSSGKSRDNKSYIQPQRLESLVPDGSYVLKEYTEIYPLMEALELDVSSLLNIDKDAAEILLQNFKWSRERLVDAFFVNSETILKDAGIDLYSHDVIHQRIMTFDISQVDEIKSDTSTVAQTSVAGLECGICYSEFTHKTGFAMGCNHWFCHVCYSEQLKTQIGDGPSCIKAKCPAYKCSQSITRSVFELLLRNSSMTSNVLSEGESFKSVSLDSYYDKYRMYVLRNFIDTSKNMKYCPAANCTKVAVGSGVTVSFVLIIIFIISKDF